MFESSAVKLESVFQRYKRIKITEKYKYLKKCNFYYLIGITQLDNFKNNLFDWFKIVYFLFSYLSMEYLTYFQFNGNSCF